jgi:predicted RNase H-like HicB family nuclease
MMEVQEVDYTHAEKYRGVSVWLGKLDADSFIAVSHREPAFCVGGKSPNEAKEKAERAIDFYLDGMDRW